MILYIAGEREALGHVDSRPELPGEFAVLAGAGDEHSRGVSEHLSNLRNRELSDLEAVGRSRRDSLARRIERERGWATSGVHILAHPHVGVLLPEGVLVNPPVLAAVERERIADK